VSYEECPEMSDASGEEIFELLQKVLERRREKKLRELEIMNKEPIVEDTKDSSIDLSNKS
jgi:hypothetical protein